MLGSRKAEDLTCKLTFQEIVAIDISLMKVIFKPILIFLKHILLHNFDTYISNMKKPLYISCDLLTQLNNIRCRKGCNAIRMLSVGGLGGITPVD